MKRAILFAALALAAVTATAQSATTAPAFKSGEYLEYVVSYRAKLVPNTEVAEVTIKTTQEALAGAQTFHINAHGRVLPFFNWFFGLNDKYDAWLDATTLRPVKFTADIREGEYRFSSSLAYDWGRMVATSTYRNHKNPDQSTKTLALTPSSFDGISLFFNLRSTSADDYVVGAKRTMNLVLEDMVRPVRYSFLGREVKTIKGLGKFNTLKFSCQLATSTGEAFKDGTELFIWISDDQNKIPLYIESPIRVGSVRARLRQFNNLKYPLESKIQ